jgi:uncharacterized membrane protein HdeD (DUF308 family)
MQMAPNDLNEIDRQAHRRWTVAFGIVYGTIALVFAGLIVNHPPITTAVVNQVEGVKSAEVTGMASDVSRTTKRTR